MRAHGIGGWFRGVLLGAAIVSAIAIARPQPAAACSCAPPDHRSSLEEADAAFVGVYLGDHRFEVEHALKGGLGDRVEVSYPSDPGACGLGVEVGQRIGLLLHRRDGGWHSDLCSSADPTRLLEATKPLPKPTSTEAVNYLLAGRYGPYRLIALDTAGEVVAYGSGKGLATALSVCPRRAHVLEIFSLIERSRVERAPSIGVRRVADLALVSERRLTDLADSDNSQWYIRALSCRSEDGDEALLFVTEEGSAEQRGHIIRLSDGRMTTLWEGVGTTATFTDGAERAFVAAPLSDERQQLLEVNLASGEARALGETRGWVESLAVSPDGRRLAGVIYSSPVGGEHSPPSQVVLVDLDHDPPLTRTSDLGRENVTGEVLWLDENRFVFVPTDGDTDAIRLYDRELQSLGGFVGWSGANDVALVGGRLVALRQPDEMRGISLGCIDPDTGSTGELETFEEAPLSVVAVVGDVPPKTCGDRILDRVALDVTPRVLPGVASAAWRPSPSSEVPTEGTSSTRGAGLLVAVAAAALGIALAGVLRARLRGPS